MITFVVLFIAAFCAGVQNALAGGGIGSLMLAALTIAGLGCTQLFLALGWPLDFS